MKEITKNVQRLCAVAAFQAAVGLVLCGYAWVRLGNIAETTKEAEPTHHAALAAQVVPPGHPREEEAKKFLSDHFEADMKSYNAWVASAVGWRDRMLVFGAFFAFIFLSAFPAFLSAWRSNKAFHSDGSRAARENRR